MNDAMTVIRAKLRLPVAPLMSCLPRFAALAACAALGACSAQNAAPRVAAVAPAVAVDPTLGVAASPQVVAAGQPVPKGGGVYSVGKPYAVAGKVYSPAARKPGPVGVGLASFYGERFHGRRTANGEIFDATSLTAAHPSLPLPSYVRVTNVSNGRSVVVRVNDRGPFHRGRLIDVSKRTADVLGFRQAGVGAVKIDYVGLAPLAGSDDRKLLATYKEFGRPGAPEGVQVAGLKPVTDAELLGGAAVAAPTVVASAAQAPRVETNLVASYAPQPAPLPPSAKLPAASLAPVATAIAQPVVAAKPVAVAKPTIGAKPEPQFAAVASAPKAIESARAEPVKIASTTAKPASKRVVKATEEPVLATVAPQLPSAEASDEPAPALRPSISPAVSARIAASFEGFGDTPAFARGQDQGLGSASAFSTLR